MGYSPNPLSVLARSCRACQLPVLFGQGGISFDGNKNTFFRHLQFRFLNMLNIIFPFRNGGKCVRDAATVTHTNVYFKTSNGDPPAVKEYIE